ncbi:(2Fe-2S)-binding protein [Photobacterium aquae]|uniref:(2Fe-2S)-binding protein n=1 Tax=Photobacterium aquae TaxID=1195763 RepID=UPI00069F93A2|nr:(2Fe-2S)-binding protein [Photobacterium aquae]
MTVSQYMADLWPGQPVQNTLAAQFDWLHQCLPFLRLQTAGGGASLSQWIPSKLDPAIESFCNAKDVRHSVGASLWLKSFNAHLFTGLAALRLKFNRVPALTEDAIIVDINAEGKVKQLSILDSQPFYCLADDSMAEEPQALVVANEAELDRCLAEILTGLLSYLEPEFKRNNIGRQLFVGSVGYALGTVFAKLTEKGYDRDQLARLLPVADNWLKTVLPAAATLNTVTQATQCNRAIYYVRRETCCLKYKLAGKKNCGTCQLTDAAEQLASYQTKVPTELAQG